MKKQLLAGMMAGIVLLGTALAAEAAPVRPPVQLVHPTPVMRVAVPPVRPPVQLARPAPMQQVDFTPVARVNATPVGQVYAAGLAPTGLQQKGIYIDIGFPIGGGYRHHPPRRHYSPPPPPPPRHHHDPHGHGGTHDPGGPHRR